MNINELADELEKGGGHYMLNIASMLRQQQAEIAELKHINKNWQISENILLLELEKLQHRELTDEEIREYILEMPRHASRDELLMFARAILRKAQEK